MAGNFSAFGLAPRFDPFSQSIKTGNFFDEVLGYIEVAAGAGKGLSAYSVALGQAEVTQGNIGSIASADLNSASAVVNDSGFARLSDSRSFASLQLGTTLFASNIRTYERSANPADVARFASISYGFTEQLIAVPEPQSWALMLAGLAFVATVKGRRRGTDRR